VDEVFLDTFFYTSVDVALCRQAVGFSVLSNVAHIDMLEDVQMAQ